MERKAPNAGELTPRRTRVLYACALAASLLAALWAAQDLREASSQAGVCASPPAGMAAWWTGDGNAGNLLVGVNNGTLEGSVTFTAGRVGQAFNLNGTNADVKINASPALNVGSGNGFTIDAWINPATLTPSRPPGMPLVEWNNGAGNVGAHFWISVGGSSGNLFANIYDTSGVAHVISSSSNLITAGTFQHVALTYDKTTGIGTLYRNGSIVAQQNLGSFTPQTSHNLYLGLRPSGDGAGARYTGRLDEVGLFSRALSQAEIQSIVAADTAGKCKTTITVKSAADDGPDTLRQAIITSNALQGTQTIAFNIPGSGVRTIALLKGLPDITAPVVIDGYTQPGASPNTLDNGNNATLLIELSGASLGVGPNGPHVTGGGTTIRGLVINRFKGDQFDRGNGIYLHSSGNRVEGCFIGTDASGTADLGNGLSGIFVGDTVNGVGKSGVGGNTIGGTTPAARNVISGNNAHGIDLLFSDGNTIAGNYIGTTRSGAAPLGNGSRGILLNASPNNTVGGATAAARNVIASNGEFGIFIAGAAATGNTVAGNSIGTGPGGVAQLGNGRNGILIESSNNVIGSASNPISNLIYFNTGDGIFITGGTGNSIEGSRNSIFANGGLGIDLADDDVTPNDPDDSDGGPNRRQNFPVLTSAVVNGSVAVSGSLNSNASATNYRIDFFSGSACDPKGNGEGQTFIGSFQRTTSAQGFVSFSNVPVARVAIGQFVTATATNLSTNDTSEFSKCIAVSGAQQIPVSNTNDDGDGSLRRALEDIAAGGTIDLGPGATGIVNLNLELVINRSVIIKGPAAGTVTLSGGKSHRVLRVAPGGVADVSRVSFSLGHSADVGGAILNEGRLTLSNCNVSASDAAQNGGGIYNNNTLTLKGSTITFNAADEGGGLYNTGTADISGSTFDNNVGRSGGGIFSHGPLTITNSTIAENHANERGAGITIDGVDPAVLNSVTVAGNVLLGLNGSGGGIFNLAPAGALSLRNSIVAGNVEAAGADDINGAVNSLDYNLIGNVAGANLSGLTEHNVLGKPPRLGPLKNNGGPTDTLSLLDGSPALDAGDDAGATDQRGRPRKIDGNSNRVAAVDIGAFESGFAVHGRVLDEDNGNFKDVTLILSGGSILSSDSVTRTALSTGEGGGDPNFVIMDVPAGEGYKITAKAPETFESFFYFFESVCVDVSAGGDVLACGTQNVVRSLEVRGEKKTKRFANIKGRVTDSAGGGLGGVTITLSGPKTVVLSLPECPAQDAACGLYTFADVPTGADYTMTPKKGQIGFTAQPFDNTRGGADINQLGLNDPVAPISGKVEISCDFKAGSGPAPPPPSDDFTDASVDPDRFKTGILSLASDSLSTAVVVKQGNGQLQITTPASVAPPAQGANASAVEPQKEKFNGYVSVRDIDLNTSTNVSVKADAPIFDGGAQTVFSFGSDSDNFFRIRVGGPSSTLGEPASQANAASAANAAADTPTIFFETFKDGHKSPQSASAAFKSDEHVYWRLRFEPWTPTPNALCTDTSAREPFVLFETSVDRAVWRTQHCAPVGSGRSTHVAAELLAGVVGDTRRNADTAKFSDYRVTDAARMGFERHAAPEPEVERGTQIIELTLARGADDSGGDVSSAASVVLRVAGDAGEAKDACSNTNAPPCKVFFGPGQKTTTFSFKNPAPDAADGAELSLSLDAAVGGALDPSSSALKLRVVDHGFRGNRIGESDFFAAQHYCDFLGRPPDSSGLKFWTDEIEKCNTDQQCREVKRINVSAAFFLSIESKETGYFVHKLYEISFGRMPLRTEFLDGAGAVGKGVVVGPGDWQNTLNNNKDDFVRAWVQRADFRERFDTLKSAEFVDTLYANAGVTPDGNVRAHLILELATGGMTRAQVLRSVAEDGGVSAAHFNRAFVLMQYFGYLRRDPDGVGFNFWLQKLEDFGGDFVKAEMVKAFITSDEYRSRFKDKPTNSCGP